MKDVKPFTGEGSRFQKKTHVFVVALRILENVILGVKLPPVLRPFWGVIRRGPRCFNGSPKLEVSPNLEDGLPVLGGSSQDW